LIQFELKAEAWPKTREIIVPMAHLAEANIRNWEQLAAPEVWRQSPLMQAATGTPILQP